MKTINNEILYSCPFCKKRHILNLDKTIEEVKKYVLGLIDKKIELCEKRVIYNMKCRDARNIEDKCEVCKALEELKARITG